MNTQPSGIFPAAEEKDMKPDRLTDLFLMMLRQTENLAETAAHFIQRVSAAYALELMQQGEIPIMFMEDVLMDLEAEVLEMYRKKTYGSLTLREFREKNFKNL